MVASFTRGLQKDGSAVFATTPDPSSTIQSPFKFSLGMLLVTMLIPHAWLFGCWFQILESFVSFFLETPQVTALLAAMSALINVIKNFFRVSIAHQVCDHFLPATKPAVVSARKKQTKTKKNDAQFAQNTRITRIYQCKRTEEYRKNNSIQIPLVVHVGEISRNDLRPS